MSKAVLGALEIGASVAVLLLAPELLAVMPLALTAAIGGSLTAMGLGTEISAAGDALQGNPAIGASVKLPTMPRDIVYGQVRKGGVVVFESTTGHQLNQVIAWASHPIYGIDSLYLDQRKLYYTDDPTDGTPWGGGHGDGSNRYDDAGNEYNFSTQVSAFHWLGVLWGQGGSPMWSAGMTTVRSQLSSGGTFITPVVGVNVSGTTYIYACQVPGTAGSSSSVFTTGIGDHIVDGSITWVCMGAAPGGYWIKQLNDQNTAYWQNNCLLQGIAATYLKLTYDAALFNGPPEIRATIRGECNIYDPRLGTYGYTNNAALVLADFLCDPVFGFGLDYATQIDHDQLIAAANICDEQVPLAAGSISGTLGAWRPSTAYLTGNLFTYGGIAYQVTSNYTSGTVFGITDPSHIAPYFGSGAYESRYTINGFFNTDQERGETRDAMLMAMEGRITVQGGVRKIYPAAWYGTSLSFTEDDLADGVQYSPSRKFRDRINCVRGTYVSPQYPYAVVGYNQDNRDNNVFNGEWEPTDFPQYAQDYLHGYGSITDPGNGDVNLVQDGLRHFYADRRYQFVTSCATAQRLAKIFLMRNRQQGSGSLTLKLTALQAQCQDVIAFTFPALSMTSQYFEVTKFALPIEDSKSASGGGASPAQVRVQLDLVQSDPSVYAWSPAEEMTVLDQPSPVQANTLQVGAPTGLSGTSSLSTALVQPDGTVIPRIELTWTEPDDPFVTTGGSIEVQMTPHAAGTWNDVAKLGGAANLCFIGGVVVGNSYDLRIRGLRPSGAYSAWVEVDAVVCGVALTASGLRTVAPSGTLASLTTGPTAAEVFVFPFIATYGGQSAACLASGAVTLTGLAPQTGYWVYYVDATFAGGAISPIATTNSADFIGQPGYWLIGYILTPAYSSGGGGDLHYYPSSTSALGSSANLLFLSNVNDGDLSTCGRLTGILQMSGATPGQASLYGFPSLTAPSGMALYVTLAESNVGAGSTNPWAITANIGCASIGTGALSAWNSRGAWAASTAYAVNDAFTSGGVTYLVVTAYTSGGSFGSTDLAKVTIVVASGTGAVAQTTYSVPVPTGAAIGSVSVICNVQVAGSPTSSIRSATLQLYEVYIA